MKVLRVSKEKKFIGSFIIAAQSSNLEINIFNFLGVKNKKGCP